MPLIIEPIQLKVADLSALVPAQVQLKLIELIAIEQSLQSEIKLYRGTPETVALEHYYLGEGKSQTWVWRPDQPVLYIQDDLFRPRPGSTWRPIADLPLHLRAEPRSMKMTGPYYEITLTPGSWTLNLSTLVGTARRAATIIQVTQGI